MSTNKDDYAIVVGINRYRQLHPLSAAEKDAARFMRWLQSPTGGKLSPDNIKLIVSQHPNPSNPMQDLPNRDDIDSALISFGAEVKQKIGRRLYFYFAGHGVGPSVKEVAMLMANAAEARLGNNIGLQRYLDYLQKYKKFEEVIFILDCCRDPFETVSTQGPSFTPNTPTSGPRVAEFVVLAAGYGEKAYEARASHTGEPRGLLTEVLLEALTSPEGANERGEITEHTLKRYLASYLPIRTAGDQKLRQIPEFIEQSSGSNIVFCSVPPQEMDVQIYGPPGTSRELVLYGSDMIELARCAANNANPWQLRLNRAGRYLIELDGHDLTIFLDLRKKDEPYAFHFPVPQ